MTEQEDVLRRFMEELRKPTGDGAIKRGRNEKPPWYQDGSHWPALWRHLAAWKGDEGLDPDSKANHLVHMAWRCLAIACIESGNVPEQATPWLEITKRCSRCKEMKPLRAFTKGGKKSVFGRGGWCLECHSDNERERRFGLARDEFDALLESQGGRCAICGRKQNVGGRRFAIDHSHATGVVRGILCSNCNTGIGMFDDDTELLQSAIMYLVNSTDDDESVDFDADRRGFE